MLLKLKLTNFRQHKNTILEFVPGINTIVGENNSGKSTIPEAIEFGLYGSRALRDSAKGFITDGESDGSAVVKLSINEDLYTVGRNSKNAELRKNGVLEGQYKENVSKDVCTITGVNQTGFRLGHYVRQKELAAFSNMRPGKRHETIEKMLKVHAIDKAIDLVKEEASFLDTKQKILISSYIDIDTTQVSLDDTYIVKQMLIERGSKYQEQLDSIKDVLESTRAAHAARIEAIAKDKYNTKTLAKWEEDCRQASLAVAELSKIQDAIAKLDWSTYDEVKTKADEIRTLEVAHAKMSSIKKELDTILTQPIEVQMVEEPDKSLLQEIQALIKIKRSQLSTIKTLVDKATCPTCQGPLNNIALVIEELTAEITDLLSKEKILDEQLGQKIHTYTEANRAYQNYKLQLNIYNDKMAKKAELLKTYVEVNFSVEDKLFYESKLKELQAVKEESIRLQGEINRLTPLAITPLKPTIEAVVIGTDVTEKLNELETLATEINELFRTQASELAHTESKINELEQLIVKNKESKTLIDTNAKQLADLKSEQEAFVMFKRYLTAKIRPMLQEVAEALYHKVTKNRYASYQLGSDYDISLTSHKGYIRKLSTISGSENDLACLCLRLAIATLRSTKLTGSLGFVILDEISGSFDDDRTRQTLEGLIELKDVIPQIINITHKPVEIRFADKLFTVKEQNGIANVTYM
jgi:exonuclease SbcC